MNQSSSYSLLCFHHLFDFLQTYYVNKCCLPKHQGGLGFKDLACFNQALLAKQSWRLLQFPESLFARVLKSRYFSDSSFLEVVVGSRPSFGRRSIVHGRDLLSQCLQKCVGNGLPIKVWSDQWLSDGEMRAPWVRLPFDNMDILVNELIGFNNRNWNLPLLNDLFYPADVRLIVKSKPVVSKDDFWVWKHTKSGAYSVKSGYWLAFQLNKASLIAEAIVAPSLNGLKESVWSLRTSPKIRFFLWKILCNALPVSDLLSMRCISLDSRCQFCGFEGESINHVLFS